jgi:hypothetical protein
MWEFWPTDWLFLGVAKLVSSVLFILLVLDYYLLNRPIRVGNKPDRSAPQDLPLPFSLIGRLDNFTLHKSFF